MRIPLTYQFDQSRIIGYVELNDDIATLPDIADRIIAPALQGETEEEMKIVCYGLIHIKNALAPTQ